MFKRFSALLVLLAFLIPVIAQAQDLTGTPDAICAAATPAEEPATRTYTEVESVLEPGVDYRAVFCTEAGSIYVDLFEMWTPVTVNNFVFLAENGYYNNTTFHRVLENFMAQGGDPQGTGAGGPGYQFKDEFVGFLTFDRPGLLAMANANRPDQGITGTNGSQFFITTVPTEYLNYRHTIFGEVLEGQEVVENLKLRDPNQSPDFPGAALDTVVIITDTTSVETTFTENDEKSTQADVEAVFAGIAEQWADLLSVNEELSGTRTTSEVISSLPQDIQSDPAAAELLEDLGHEYRITQRLNNIDCNAQIPFAWISYTVDAYEDAFSAGSLLSSSFMNDIATAEGFELVDPSDTLPYPAFTQAATSCDGSEGVQARTFFQRGRFVVTTEILFPVNFLPEDISMDFAVSVLVEQLHLLNIFEPFFGPVYQLETR